MQSLSAQNNVRLGTAAIPTFIVGYVVFFFAIVFDQKLITIAGQIMLWTGMILGYRVSHIDNLSGTRITMYTSTVGRNTYVTFNLQGCTVILAAAMIYFGLWTINQKTFTLAIACILLMHSIMNFYGWSTRRIWFGWKAFFGY